MKQALVVLGVVILGIAATFHFLPERTRRLQAPGGGERQGNQQVEKNPFDPTRGRARDVFSPDFRTIDLDGESVTYQSLLLWCERTRPGDGDTVVLENIRLLINPEPKNRAELEQLYTVSPSTPAGAVGAEIQRRLGQQSGVTAGRAILRGGDRLSTADAIDLEERVKLWIADSADPDRRAVLETRTLNLVLEDGRISRATNDEDVVITSQEGQIRGSGLDVDVSRRTALIHRRIRGRIDDAALLGRRGGPIRISGSGPLVMESEPESGGDAPLTPLRSLAASPSRLRLEGDVEISQDESLMRGKRLDMAFAGDRRISSARLEGGVEAETPEGRFLGRRALFERRDADLVDVVIEGPGVRARLNQLGRMLPTGRTTSELVIETDGRIAIERTRATTGKVAEALVGPGVVLRSDETVVKAPHLTVHLHRIPANRAGDVADATRDVPGFVELSGGVDGSSPEARFRCERLRYRRRHDEMGLQVEDLVHLEGEPVIARKLVPRVGAPRPQTIWERLLLAEGEVEIAAADWIEVRRDPLQLRPVRVDAEKAVLVRRFEQGARPRPAVIGTFGCEHLELRLDPALGERFTAAGITSTRELGELVHFLEARGPVRGSVTSEADLSGRRLTHHAARGLTELVSDLDSAPATLQLQDDAGHPRLIEAASIAFDAELRRLRARERASATLHLPRFPFPGDVPDPATEAELVATRLAAERIDVSFAAPPVESRAPVAVGAVSQVATERKVLIRQEAAIARCHEARLTLDPRNGRILGAPARLERTREVEGRKETEFVEASRITLLDRTALLKGNVSSRFLIRKSASGSSLVLGKDEARSRAATVFDDRNATPKLVPVEVHAADSVYLSDEQVLLRGGSRVLHGDPRVDGYEISGRTMSMFLIPEAGTAPGSSRLRATRVVVETGARFTSRDIAGEGETLVLDRDRRLIRLTSKSAPSRLRLRGDLQIARDDYVLDLTDPDRPRLTSVRPPNRDPRR